MIHRTAFYEIVTAITSKDFKPTTCANYITQILVDETIERLQMFFDKIFVSITSPQYKQLSNKLTTVRDFLKVRLPLHMKREDNRGFHSLCHALNKPSLTHGANGKCCKSDTCVVCSNTDQTMKFNPVSCNGCKFPFHILSQIDKLVEETKCGSVDYCKRNLTQQDFDDGGALVGNAKMQFVTFIKATARKMNQRNAIDQLNKLMRSSCELMQDDCPIAKKTIDWTNREIEYSSRELQINYFGKRGMSWHIDATETYVWDKILQKAVKKTIYFDQIMEGSNKQDVSAVFSFLEASFVHSMVVLPKIKEIIVQSDNAMCYQNTALVTAVALLNAKLKGDIFVRQLIFTETQDGKGPSDVRGAEQKNRLRRGIKKMDMQNRIVRIKTAHDLANALIYKGGTKNGIIQLLEVDFERMDDIMKFIEPTTKEIKKFVRRKNEIQFHPSSEKITLEDWSSIDEVKNAFKDFRFTFTALAHSGQGLAIKFDRIIGEKATVEPDDVGENEINIALGMNLPSDSDSDDDSDDDSDFDEVESDSEDFDYESDNVSLDDDNSDDDSDNDNDYDQTSEIVLQSPPNSKRKEQFFKQSEDENIAKRTVLAVAVRFAKEYSQSTVCELIDTSNGDDELKAKYQEASSYVMKDEELPYPGEATLMTSLRLLT